MGDKVKVMQITSGISTEGIGTFVLNTFENINKEKIDVSFALATDWTQHHEQRIINQGGKIYRTAEIGGGTLGIIKHFVNLIKILKKEGPFDVVHSHMDFFNGINVLAAFIAGVPVRISHAHLSVNEKYISLPKKLYIIIMKLLISIFANYKVGCSEKANEYMNDLKWKKSKSKVLFNGIDLKRFSPNKNSVNSGLNINKEKLNFITIGRIDNPKNPLFIVKIIKELKEIRDDIHLYWVGTGSLENEVKQLVSKYKLENNISFLGIRDDVAEILKLMDFMLFPSKWEGLGIVLVEAQASGIPCFISNTIPKEADLGLCTILSLNEYEKKWASKIDHYINTNSYKNIINEEKLKKFDVSSTVKEIEDIYIRV
ncbi:glycosyltransferase [Bacillus sp. V3B]|uniref:glycosyltransferase n=1 Tax=Bacillus sp. V3B TaxID=2804915 RepID=UPI002108D9D5|nr:glycosyltransferase [Bacillus sp. V3B]MCQ6275282.1 glycosyltransferase [Bacillus sp. V3B]